MFSYVQVFKHRLERESKMRAEKEAERAKAAAEEASGFAAPCSPSLGPLPRPTLRHQVPSRWVAAWPPLEALVLNFNLQLLLSPKDYEHVPPVIKEYATLSI